jgi:hypothetical protein
MKNINAAVRPNGALAMALASRRENGMNTGSIKRQSSRQMRQRLDAYLRAEVHTYLVAEERQRKIDAWFTSEGARGAVLAAERATAGATAHLVREVEVTSIVKLSPFMRKQVTVAVLAV